MPLKPGTRLVRTRSRQLSAQAEWARSIARATRSSIATSHSRCCRISFADDPERLARFDREAQLLASLNHPHIAQIYGFEDPLRGAGQAAVRALVMELVEGPTLADRIARGPFRSTRRCRSRARSPRRSKRRTSAGSSIAI